MIEENHEKTTIRLVGTGIWTRDLPNASLVRYHGATSLGNKYIHPTSSDEEKNGFRCFALPSYERGLTTKIISLLHSFIILV